MKLKLDYLISLYTSRFLCVADEEEDLSHTIWIEFGYDGTKFITDIFRI